MLPSNRLWQGPSTRRSWSRTGRAASSGGTAPSARRGTSLGEPEVGGSQTCGPGLNLAVGLVIETAREATRDHFQGLWPRCRSSAAAGPFHHRGLAVAGTQSDRPPEAERAATRRCLECGSPLRGRPDKRFCCSPCRTRFGRERKAREIGDAIERLMQLLGVSEQRHQPRTLPEGAVELDVAHPKQP